MWGLGQRPSRTFNYEVIGMRKAIIAGNWKMNKTPAEAAALVNDLKPLVKDASCDVVV